jgi:calcyclin binding protein
MVEIEQIIVEEDADDVVSPSQERLLDAEEIENVVGTLTRPTARMQLESLAKKLRKEAAALKVVEASRAKLSGEPVQSTARPSPATATPPVAAVAPPPSPSVKYTTIDRFSFDAGGSNDRFVTLYIPLPAVGDIPKDQVTCEFGKAKFDLIVVDLKGKSYRLFKDHLEHDIVPETSKFIVKADKVVVKLAKTKGEYGSYDYWSKVTDPKRGTKKKEKKSNPADSINDLMKDMYDSGDDKMRKMIGETLMKQRTGQLGKDPMGGMGGMGDMTGGMGDMGDFGSGFDDEI